MPDQPTGYPEGLLNPLRTPHQANEQPLADSAWPPWTGDESRRSSTTPLLHEIVSTQARIRPSAIAVKTPTASVSYGDLDLWTNQLANHLRAIGLNTEDTVALCFEDTLEALIGLIGVVKAGAGYLPIDPYLPQEEWTARVQQAECNMLLTTAQLATEWPELPIRQICMDAAWQVISRAPKTLPPISYHSDQLASTVHFCGTRFLQTGLQMSHHALVQMTRASQQTFGLKASDRLLQISPLASAFAPAEIFPAWMSGATLITGLDLFCHLDAILEFAEEQQVTVIHLPGDAWLDMHHRLNDNRLELPENLRLIVVADEALQPKHLRSWRNHFGERVDLQTTYGTSDPQLRTEDKNLDIRAYVLSKDLQPIGPNETGELFIAGVGVGRGFCQNLPQTAACFLPDPLPSKPGERMYRTGHRVRALEDGSLEFVSHLDQPALRGLKLDLGSGHASYREPTSIEAFFLTPSTDADGPENTMLRRLQGQLGGCVRSSLPSYNRLSLDDFVTRLVMDHLSRLGVKQAIH